MTTFPTKRIIPMQLPFYPSIRSGEEVETVSKKLEPGTINRFYVIPIPRNGEIIKNYRHISRSTVRLPPPVEKTKKGKLHFHTPSLRCSTLLHPLVQAWANIGRPCARSSPIEIQSFPERDAHSVSFFFRAWTRRRRYELPNVSNDAERLNVGRLPVAGRGVATGGGGRTTW